MANFWSGEDFVFGTNQPLICDPTTTASHGTEEPFSSYPKISKVWSITNPTNLLTPQPVLEEGEMEAGDEAQPEPLPPLRLRVQLPTRQSFLANGVHHLELVLLYGHLEEHVLMIDIHGPLMELPIQKPSETEIPTSDNSVPINSFPSPSPILNLGAVESFENPPLQPSHPPRKEKITARRRRKHKQSTTCLICHKKFTNKYSAAAHSFVHLSQEGKEAVKQGWRYKCYFCSKRFQKPSHLDIHLVVHTREKPHPCHKCGRKFNLKGSLTTHLRLHNSNQATRRPFNCEECDKAFTQKSSLTVHVTMIHLRLKQFQCLECDQKFVTRSHLVRHHKGVHLQIRHPCPCCEKSFSEIWILNQHRKKAHP